MRQRPRPQALVIISSAHDFPITGYRKANSISTGCFLVELAQILQEFGGEFDFTFATPDGRRRQLDVNGMDSAMHAGRAFGATIAVTTLEQ